LGTTTLDPARVSAAIDQLVARRAALGRRSHLVDEMLGDADAGDVFVHKTGHGRRGEKDHARQDLRGKLARICHEGLEFLQVVDRLGLDELGAGLDLLFELDELRRKGIGLRGGCSLRMASSLSSFSSRW
jgi:hypothetical protein